MRVFRYSYYFFCSDVVFHMDIKQLTNFAGGASRARVPAGTFLTAAVFLLLLLRLAEAGGIVAAVVGLGDETDVLSNNMKFTFTWCNHEFNISLGSRIK